jgi:hypothetical protein
MLVVYLIIEYPTLGFLKPKAIVPSAAQKKWLDTAIQISASKNGGTFESVYHITNHIIRYYHNSFLLACKTQ